VSIISFRQEKISYLAVMESANRDNLPQAVQVSLGCGTEGCRSHRRCGYSIQSMEPEGSRPGKREL